MTPDQAFWQTAESAFWESAPPNTMAREAQTEGQWLNLDWRRRLWRIRYAENYDDVPFVIELVRAFVPPSTNTPIPEEPKPKSAFKEALDAEYARLQPLLAQRSALLISRAFRDGAN